MSFSEDFTALTFMPAKLWGIVFCGFASSKCLGEAPHAESAEPKTSQSKNRAEFSTGTFLEK